LGLTLLAACVAVDSDGDGVPARSDCNDQDPTQGLPFPLFLDSDSDGHGGTETEVGCPGNTWLTRAATDCDDQNPDIRPGALEVGCDGVDNDCDPATPDGPAVAVGATFRSVNLALAAAGYGEVVSLCASNIDETVLLSRGVTLAGMGAGYTILDGGGRNAAVITIVGGGAVRDITIRGGSGTLGGGVRVEGEGLATLDSVEIVDNEASQGGGVAVLQDASLLVVDSTIHDNRASQGGGLYLAGDAELRDTQVRDNLADHGGGAWASGALTLWQTDVLDNFASKGGGLWVVAGGRVDGSGSAVAENNATDGGGVWGSGEVSGLIVQGNFATDGAGVWASGSLLLDRVSLTGNTATGRGGAIFAAGPTTIVGSGIEGNAAEQDGGGAYVTDDVAFTDCRVADNTANRGGGLFVGPGAACALTGSELSNNTALAAGGGLFADCAGHTTLQGGELSDNTAPRGAAGEVSGATLVLEGSRVVENEASEIDGAAIRLEPATCDPAILLSSGSTEFSGNTTHDIAAGPDRTQAHSDDFQCAAGTTAQACLPIP